MHLGNRTVSMPPAGGPGRAGTRQSIRVYHAGPAERRATLAEHRIRWTLEVVSNGAGVGLGPPKGRALPAILPLNADQIVSTGRLIELIWLGRETGRSWRRARSGGAGRG
jgi:hypothetical protein